MKNVQKLLLVAIVTMIGSNQLLAQISVGPQIGYAYSIDGYKHVNLGLRGDKQVDDRTGTMVSLAYHLPHVSTSFLYLSSNTAGVTQAKVTTRDRVVGYKLVGNLKRYFAGTEYDNGFGVYGILGIGLSVFRLNKTIEDEYDRDVYRQPAEYENDKFNDYFLGFTMNGGIGTELMIGDNSLFLELKLLIPASQVGNQDVDVQIPGFLHLTAGYRFGMN